LGRSSGSARWRAKAFIAYLKAPAATAMIKAKGMNPG